MVGDQTEANLVDHVGDVVNDLPQFAVSRACHQEADRIDRPPNEHEQPPCLKRPGQWSWCIGNGVAELHVEHADDQEFAGARDQEERPPLLRVDRRRLSDKCCDDHRDVEEHKRGEELRPAVAHPQQERKLDEQQRRCEQPVDIPECRWELTTRLLIDMRHLEIVEAGDAADQAGHYHRAAIDRLDTVAEQKEVEGSSTHRYCASKKQIQRDRLQRGVFSKIHRECLGLLNDYRRLSQQSVHGNLQKGKLQSGSGRQTYPPVNSKSAKPEGSPTSILPEDRSVIQ